MPELDAAERDAVLAERDRQEAEKPPRNLRGSGCLLFLLGGVMLCALPVFLADRAQSQDSKMVMTVVVIALTVIGIWLMVRGNRQTRLARAQVDAALAALRQSAALCPEDRRAAAVRLARCLSKRDWERRVEKAGSEIPDWLPYVLAVRAAVEGKPHGAASGGGAGSRSPS
jgi:hypothetical protein